MIQYLICLLTIISIFSFSGCGDGKSKNTKNILSKKTDILIAGKPYEAVCADFNGDTWSDLAVTVKYSGVYVFFNNGKDFSDFIKFSGPFAHGISIKHADFNGDGENDLAVLVENAVQFFTGDGEGHFTVSGKYYSGPVMSTYIETADLNNDFLPDIIAVGQTDSRIFIYINEGSLNFKMITINLQPAETLLPPEFRQVSAADLDGDGLIDILVADSQNKIIWVLWNNGKSTFLPERIYTAGARISSTTAYTPAGKYLPDIILAEEIQDGELVFLSNKGNRKFEASGRIRVDPYPYYLVIEDMNADNYKDILITHLISDEYGKGKITVLFGPFFDKHYSTSIGGMSLYATVCDWNRDGLPDIIAPSPFSDTLTYIPSSIIK